MSSAAGIRLCRSTGITRVKKLFVMVGAKKALAYAVGNVTVAERNTLLKERMSGERGRQP